MREDENSTHNRNYYVNKLIRHMYIKRCNSWVNKITLVDACNSRLDGCWQFFLENLTNVWDCGLNEDCWLINEPKFSTGRFHGCFCEATCSHRLVMFWLWVFLFLWKGKKNYGKQPVILRGHIIACNYVWTGSLKAYGGENKPVNAGGAHSPGGAHAHGRAHPARWAAVSGQAVSQKKLWKWGKEVLIKWRKNFYAFTNCNTTAFTNNL